MSEGWIEVRKDAPIEGERVLVWDGKHVNMTTYWNGEFLWDRKPDGITHWQPLPPPPRGE